MKFRIDEISRMLGPWSDVDNPSGLDISTPEAVFKLIGNIATVAIWLSLTVAVALLIYAGITYITSAGDEEKVRQGSGMITATIIGMIIIFLSAAIIQFVIDNFLS